MPGCRSGCSGTDAPARSGDDADGGGVFQDRERPDVQGQAPSGGTAVAQEVSEECRTTNQLVKRTGNGIWLCFGSADEPWFQKKERIDARYH